MQRTLTKTTTPALVQADVPMKDGSLFKLFYMCPNRMLRQISAENSQVASVFADMLAAKNDDCIELSLLYTSDETFSGNPLHDSGRKI